MDTSNHLIKRSGSPASSKTSLQKRLRSVIRCGISVLSTLQTGHNSLKSNAKLPVK